MIIGAEIILEGEVGVGVEIDMDVTGTERGIITVVAGVVALVPMITGGVAETEVLVVAGAAATVLQMTGRVAETVCRLHAEALVAPLARHHLLTRDLLSGAMIASLLLGAMMPSLLLGVMMTGLQALVALQHELNVKQLRINGTVLLISEAVQLLYHEQSAVTN